MDVLKVTTDDLRKLDHSGLSSAENDVRKKLAEIRIDVYGNPSSQSSTKQKLKKTLARIQSVRGENSKKQS